MFFDINKNHKFRSPADFTVIKIRKMSCKKSKHVRRTFLFFSLKGSLTLEAALVLPLYMFFLITIIFILNILYVQNVFQASMEEAVRNINSYAYVSEQFQNLTLANQREIASQNEQIVTKLAAKQLSKIALMNCFLTDDVKEIASDSYIKNGSSGIWSTLSIGDDSDYADFKIAYSFKIPFLPSGTFYIPVTQHCYFKPFTGEDIEDNKSDYVQYVYITATGTAYHTSRYCTYLNKYCDMVPEDLMNVTWDTAEGYQPCIYCAYGNPIGPTSFLCPNSMTYHNSLDCSKLETTVYKVPIDSVGIRHLCTRCEKQGVNQ